MKHDRNRPADSSAPSSSPALRLRRGLAFAAVVAALSCTGGPKEKVAEPSGGAPERVDAPPAPQPATEPVVAAPAGPWTKLLPQDAAPRGDLGKLKHIERIPSLTDEHRRQLTEHGFFITTQAKPEPDSKDPSQARAGRPAKHLFQVYERNDYIRFPSYVTVDLAIDLTHRYFDVVLRNVEREHLVPKMVKALTALTAQAVKLEKASKSKHAKASAHAAALYWATALRLLQQPAKGDAAEEATARPPWWGDEEMMEEYADEMPKPPPAPPMHRFGGALEREVAALVKTVHAMPARHEVAAWGQTYDLTLTKPRGHYTEAGVMQRYFRAMSLLGLTGFSIDDTNARTEVLAALALSLEAAPDGSKELHDVLRITNFVVGEPPTAGLHEALLGLRKATEATSLDDVLAPPTLATIEMHWKRLPEHPIEKAGPVVQPLGQRVFVDTQAMSGLLALVRDLPPPKHGVVLKMMGAAGAAAMLDSAAAHEVVSAAEPTLSAQVRDAINTGRTSVRAASKRDDAYHQTLFALQHVLRADPLYFDRAAHDLRMLQSFAGGWSMLRHDTLLYAYQMGAECDALELDSPYGWVEPHPELYRALATMVKSFEARLREAGISDPKQEEERWDTPYATIGGKTEALLDFLARLERWSNKELRGEPFTEDERTDVAMVGGFAEHVVLTLADAFELGEGNDDMAVIADVFTWRGQALEVGVAHPEIIYAVIPTPEGWALARGAVLAYREFFVPVSDRMTDEAWRRKLESDGDFAVDARPKWLEGLFAPPVGVIGLPPDGQGQDRCEYYGGAFEL